MPIELWEVSEFFFIHYCGRSDHFYMASLQIVLNKVYFSRYSWIGFVKNRVPYLSAMLFFRFYAALTGLLHGNHCYFKYLIDSIAVSLFADIFIELTNTEMAATTL